MVGSPDAGTSAVSIPAGLSPSRTSSATDLAQRLVLLMCHLASDGVEISREIDRSSAWLHHNIMMQSCSRWPDRGCRWPGQVAGPRL